MKVAEFRLTARGWLFEKATAIPHKIMDLENNTA
jgi:hypothetical protein